jgi:phosphoserine phosphatase
MYEKQIEQIRALMRRYDTNKVDILDLDGTVVDINLLTSTVNGILEFGIRYPIDYLVRQGLSKLCINPDHISYIDNRLTSKEAIKYIEDGLFVNVTEEQIQEIIHTGIEDIVKSCFSFPRALILAMRHRVPRRLILCITGTPQEIADVVCPLLGFDAVVGSYYPKKNGKYVDGKRNFDAGCNKRKIIKMLIKECGINLEGFIAAGDRKFDLDLLCHATYPIAMNPKRDLQQYLRKSIWSRGEFRKIAWIDQKLDRPMEDCFIWVTNKTNMLVETDISQILPHDIIELMYKIEEKRARKWFSR